MNYWKFNREDFVKIWINKKELCDISLNEFEILSEIQQRKKVIHKGNFKKAQNKLHDTHIK